jgi:ABC-2 type transport system permease protein
LLPITHFIRIIRGALLKDQMLGDMRPDILALAAFLVIAAAVTVARSRTTLD